MCLSDAEVGDLVEVKFLLVRGMTRRRLLDLGVVEGTRLEVLRKSPLGDPILYNIRGALIALHKEDTRYILVEKIER